MIEEVSDKRFNVSSIFDYGGYEVGLSEKIRILIADSRDMLHNLVYLRIDSEDIDARSGVHLISSLFKNIDDAKIFFMIFDSIEENGLYVAITTAKNNNIPQANCNTNCIFPCIWFNGKSFYIYGSHTSLKSLKEVETAFNKYIDSKEVLSFGIGDLSFHGYTYNLLENYE